MTDRPSSQSPVFPGRVRSGQPSRTALQVAMLRAVHQLLDDPLVLPDPVALPLLGPLTEAALRADPFALNDPLSRGLRAALAARSRFVEDEVASGLARGVRQVVVLGAGLDTFAYRAPRAAAGLRVYEVDHPGTQRWKQQLLADAGIAVPADLRFVPLDFERDELLPALVEAGFRAGEPAVVGWMGVTMYLGEDAVWRTLRTIAGLSPGSALCFDHRLPPERLDPVARVVDELLGRQAAAAGEPWRSAFDVEPLRQRLLAAGYASAESVAPQDLNARYFARRKDGLGVGGGLGLVCARLPAQRVATGGVQGEAPGAG